MPARDRILSLSKSHCFSSHEQEDLLEDILKPEPGLVCLPASASQLSTESQVAATESSFCAL